MMIIRQKSLIYQMKMEFSSLMMVCNDYVLNHDVSTMHSNVRHCDL